MSTKNIDVLIIGAGPVGLFCANELIRQGLTCRIIDKKDHISEHSKALGIHIRTLNVMEDCGFIEDIMQQGHQVDGVLFKSQNKTLVQASFEGVAAQRKYLIDLPQNQTESILYQALLTKGVQVEWETELTHLTQAPHEVTATIKKPHNKIELLNANWLIACDGAHSTVRHLVGAEFKGSSYKQSWWLADLLVDWKVPDNKMAIYISSNGPLACFPMGNKRYRIVMTAANEQPVDPNLQDIENAFKSRSDDPAVLSNPIWLSQFSIHHRQVQQYRYDRVFFAGDAAHIHSPMGGQGLNTGIQDIYNLAWKLALVEKGKANPDLLNSYHAERYPVGFEVLKKTDLMTRMILIKNPLLISIRNALIGFITSFKRVRNSLATDLAELAISYAKSPVVFNKACGGKMQAGDYFPDFPLTDSQNQNISTTTIVEGTLHHIFIFMGSKSNKHQDLIVLAETLAKKYQRTSKVHLIAPQSLGKLSDHAQAWVDKHNIHQRFGIKKPTLMIVRPDKYIGLTQTAISSATTLNEFYLN